MFRIFFLLIIFSLPLTIFSSPDSLKTEEFQKGLQALSNKDTAAAKTFFKQSIKKHNDAPSNYEYAKLLSVIKSHWDLTSAIEYSRRAVQLDKKNIPYRLLLAQIREDLFYASFLNVEERKAAKIEFERILEIDSTCVEAHYNLGRLLQEDFLNFNRSQIKYVSSGYVTKLDRMRYEGSSLSAAAKAEIRREIANTEFLNSIGDFTTNQMDEDVQETFEESEKHLTDVIKLNPADEKSYLLLTQMYIDNNMAAKSIPHLIDLQKVNRNSKDVSMYLGLVYYLNRENEKASKEFQKAMMKLTPEGLGEFKYETVKILLEPKLGARMENMSREEIEALVIKFWDMNDPLYLTSYNERILEHYARVAYANLFFWVPELNFTGWKTERGETLLRYGQPLNKIKYRQGADESAKNWDSPLTEVWVYSDKYFVFEDVYRNKNFTFSNPERGKIAAQFGVNSFEDFQNIKQVQFQDYAPSFEGPEFSVPFSTYQFKSEKYYHTDLFLSYNLNPADTSLAVENFNDGYDLGLFLFDLRGNKIADIKKNYVSNNFDDGAKHNSILVTTMPDTLTIAFELLRKKDKGVFSRHAKYRIKEFRESKMDISGIVLASAVEAGSPLDGAIIRKNISVIPNPTNKFTRSDQLFVYYEVYNLAMNREKLTSFDQEITIRKKDEDSQLGGILNKVGDILGIGKSGEKITLTSHYQTLERNPQIYLQLDLSGYEPANYIVTITIKDQISNTSASSSAEVVRE
ncbi:MAG: GWxTD domain-containing protein [Ignavibacteriales bacterium]|nr:GWxTD domain-containing protein [Ignavibacteriales bacterium]